MENIVELRAVIVDSKQLFIYVSIAQIQLSIKGIIAQIQLLTKGVIARKTLWDGV